MENERELSRIYRTILDIILYVLMACMAFHGCNCCEADASRNTLRHKALFSLSLSLSHFSFLSCDKIHMTPSG